MTSEKDGAREPAPNDSSSRHNQQVQRNIASITKLERDVIYSRSRAEHVADKVTTLAGSPPFLLFHILVFAAWIIVNVGLIPGLRPFDPFPFSFLTLVVSLEVILLTLLVLTNQNRMIKEADKRSHLDLQLSMLAEQESTELLKLVQTIGRHLGLEIETPQAAQDLAEEIDVHHLAKTLDEELPD
jgi:uncharacterized membrane protein